MFRSRRYILTFGSESSGSPVRLSIDARLLWGAVALLVVSPIVMTAGGTWAARTIVVDLLHQNARLQVENASYREATTELVTQVSALQAAADELGMRSDGDPDVARAMQRLPESIARRAMGGATLADAGGRVAGVAATLDPAFGLLNEIVGIFERKLDLARYSVERRDALAAATPSIWPVTGWLSSAFGTRTDPFTGARDFHSGLDIAADAGEPVRATADGVVTLAAPQGNSGNLVVLDHGYGIGTRYGHLSRFAVAAGQRVRKGDTIGYVGSTGRSTSPHLHYELFLNGRPTNPLRLLGR